jgi:hypothetical protein
MPKRKNFVLPGQMSLFTEAELREWCPLCQSARPLATCRRLYSLQRACWKCVEGLKRYGWQIVR